MNQPTPAQPYELKATILRERAAFAAFIAIVFLLAANGALFLLDQGISIFLALQGWTEGLLALGLIGLAIIVIGVTGLLLISALQNAWLAWKMEKQGQIVRGNVLKKVVLQTKKKQRYGIFYAHSDDTCFFEQVSEADYQRLQVGAPVNLRTLAGHPDITRLER